MNREANINYFEDWGVGLFWSMKDVVLNPRRPSFCVFRNDFGMSF